MNLVKVIKFDFDVILLLVCQNNRIKYPIRVCYFKGWFILLIFFFGLDIVAIIEPEF
jgi:hypothetical protein